MNIFPQDTVFRVSRWTRHDVAATPETILTMLMEAHMSCTFGNDEPPIYRMGEGFHDTLVARTNICREATNKGRKEGYQADQYLPAGVPDVDAPPLEPLFYMDIFMGARILLDDRFDSWMCHIFMWDRESYELPILFVAATVKLVDGQ